MNQIEDYAVIGNSRTAGLIGKDGSLDWLCIPRFDSPAVFCALLDDRQGGRFRISPAGPYSVSRRYRERTNILETTFTTSSGSLKLTDFMPVSTEEVKKVRPDPEHLVVRIAECLSGELDLQVVCMPRPNYARNPASISDHGKLGIWFEENGRLISLLSDFPLQINQGEKSAEGNQKILAGQRRTFFLSFDSLAPAIIAPLEYADQALEVTETWWRNWIDQSTYEGLYQEEVYRSALALKLMTYAPSGAIVAAVTTSLPESMEGHRNWDYRFCWVRDASWMVRAFLEIGLEEEASSFLRWMLQATRLTRPRLSPLYTLYGDTCKNQEQLDHLAGYRGVGPVRVGNAASSQQQLDVYGDLIAGVYKYFSMAPEKDKVTWAESKMLAGLSKQICRVWRNKDSGVWEVPGEPRHYTYSKVMCWVALELLARLGEDGYLKVPVADLRREAETIRDQVEIHGFSQELGCYTATYGGTEMDAALYLMALMGYMESSSEKMTATAECIDRQLGRHHLLMRYPPDYDTLPSKEGAFGICSFWRVQYLAQVGKIDEAESNLKKLLENGNDVGLYAEEIDPESGHFLGNFPQAFSHIALINAVLALDRAKSS